MDAPTTSEAGRRDVSTDEVIEGLNDLLQLDHDALGAYEIAIEKLQDREHADQIAGFRRDHERHVRELNESIQGLGGVPVNEPHRTGPFKRALQSLGAVAGDKGLLIAWRTNELLVRTKYDSYAKEANAWPAHLKRVIDRNALDEERHFEWVTRVLDSMGVPMAEGLESGVATRLREAGTQIENAADRVREAAGDAVDRARDQVADAADAARNRVRGALDDASTATRTGVARGLDAAADGLENWTEERTAPDDRLGRAGNRVASGMHSSARYVRNADLDRVRVDLERSLQEHPVRTLGILFATGFVVGRLLR